MDDIKRQNGHFKLGLNPRALTVAGMILYAIILPLFHDQSVMGWIERTYNINALIFTVGFALGAGYLIAAPRISAVGFVLSTSVWFAYVILSLVWGFVAPGGTLIAFISHMLAWSVCASWGWQEARKL